MKSPLRIHLMLLTLAILAGSCSELKKDLPSPVALQSTVHPQGWNDTSSAQFHGTVLKENSYNSTGCVKCHAASYAGGTSGISCFKCHEAYPHLTGWGDPTSAVSHGAYLAAKSFDLTSCVSCHGADFRGGSSGKSCYACHGAFPHGSSWLVMDSPLSHGAYLKGLAWQTDQCAACHGTAFAGGNTGVSCFTCHASFPHSVKFASGGHRLYLYTSHYPLAACQSCHGASYTGGSVVDISCESSGCHVDRNGTGKTPEACNTCHGDFRALAGDFLSSAPPVSVLGDSLTSAAGVGAHQAHLRTGVLGKLLKCQECHSVPSTWNAPGHTDTPLPAEVAMTDTLANLVTGDGTLHPAPVFDGTKCSNTYCHGTWKLRQASSNFGILYLDSVMVGASFAPAWTGGAAQAPCGSCHGLPPVGHVPYDLTFCFNCHGDVIDATGAIINPAKHINGKINVFGAERDMH